MQKLWAEASLLGVADVVISQPCWSEIFQRGHLGVSGNILGVLLALCRWKPGELLNILQGTTENHSAPNVNSAQAQKPCLFFCISASFPKEAGNLSLKWFLLGN